MTRGVVFVTAGLLLQLSAGCRSSSDPATGDLQVDLQHADPRVRIDTAAEAVAKQRLDLCPLLIHNLRDRDPAVRLFTAIALRKLTSEDFYYPPEGTAAEREVAVLRWEAWWQSQDPARHASEPTEGESSPPVERSSPVPGPPPSPSPSEAIPESPGEFRGPSVFDGRFSDVPLIRTPAK